MEPRRTKILLIALAAVSVVIVLALGLGIGLGLGLRKPLGSASSQQAYQHAAVATDSATCSQVGVDILKKGGSAVDSAVASTFCLGVVNLHSTGVGGGGFMLYYNATSRESTFLDFREVAPLNATVNMFNSTPSNKGGLAIAVPGMVRGLETAWRMFGRLKWADLVQPSVNIARNGFTVTKTVAAGIQSRLNDIVSGKFPGLQAIVAPNNVSLKEGDILRQLQLAETLANISLYGADYMYNSSFTSDMVNELKRDYGSILSVDDFLNYTVRVREVLISQFSGLQVLGASPPSSGAVVAMVLNILEGYNWTVKDFGGLTYHRIVEAIKFAYAQRMLLADPNFNSTVQQITQLMLNTSEASRIRSLITDSTTHNISYYELPEFFSPLSNSGTSHATVLASNGDAVSTTGTINDLLGSLVCSKKNGIIFNDEMDDFGAPNKVCSLCLPPNYIEPGKRPQSSMSPTIMLDKYGKVKLVIGASGGAMIPPAILQTVLQVLQFNRTLADAITYPRLYHRLIPNQVTVEQQFPTEYQQALTSRGHTVVVNNNLAVVQGIEVIDGLLYAVSDPRKGGAPAGY